MGPFVEHCITWLRPEIGRKVRSNILFHRSGQGWDCTIFATRLVQALGTVG